VNHFRTGRLERFNPNHTYPQACTDYDKWQIAEVRAVGARAYSPRARLLTASDCVRSAAVSKPCSSAQLVKAGPQARTA